MKLILFALCLIVDILIFIFLFLYEQYLVQVFIIHAILFLIIWKLSTSFKAKNEGIPVYAIFFLPIVGNIIYIVFNISLNYFHNTNSSIFEYEQLLSANLKTENRKRINYEQEIKTMSFIDMLSFIDPDRKKEILIDSQYEVKINNTNILKKGLESEDKEVQHYSATLLNSQENELTNNISLLREKFNETKDPKLLDELIKSYKVYLNSSLIEEDTISIFKEEYIEVLSIKVNKFKYKIDDLDDLFKAYLQINDLYNATMINNKIADEFGNSEDVLVNKLNIMYQQGNINQLQYELAKIDEKILNKNSVLKELYNFFERGLS
ncbi:MAG: hypothetical protein PQJ45_11610 [Sphaerochaetaceae bacterium]|nr:hypothetical protein [Sphaerochaetaceae bacterium]MDC7238405.1 hypothetical protein [Sphaerochaetaceae bacterium]